MSLNNLATVGDGGDSRWSGNTRLADEKGPLRNQDPRLQGNGAATLFAALDALEGSVISKCDDRHRRQEWLKFLRAIDDVVPEDKQIHMIVDNYATGPALLGRHPRFHMHYTPTRSPG